MSGEPVDTKSKMDAAAAGQALLAQALARHQAGRLAEAERLYKQILEAYPNQPDALHFLGVLAHQAGRYEDAVEFIRQALAIKPDYPEAHNNLGNAYQRLGRLEDAATAYGKAIEARPDYAEAHNNLGIVLRDQDKLEEAAAAHAKAIALKPGNPKAHNNLGIVLKLQGKLDDAVAECEQAIALKPDYAQAYTNLGNALRLQDKLEAALAAHQKAVALTPNSAEMHANLGISLMEEGRLEDSLKAYNRALELTPDYAEAHCGKGAVLLLLGNFTDGLKEYEWRFRTKKIKVKRPFGDREIAQPEWDGSPLGGKTLLIYDEQGLGDTIQFARYLPLVKEPESRLLFLCCPALLQLLGDIPGPDEIVEKRAWEDFKADFDFHIPLMSLPRVLGTTLETIPAEVPYLHPNPDLVTAWREVLDREAAGKAMQVGLAWAANPKYKMGRRRTCPLAEFAPLFDIPEVAFFSLQKGEGVKHLADLPDGAALTDFGSELDEKHGAFMDTAAIIANLDLVITIDTSVAHLAGALGRPVWTLLPFAPDWRWMLGREDSPWYPTMRLFRQDRPGEWEGIMRRFAAALGQSCRSRAL